MRFLFLLMMVFAVPALADEAPKTLELPTGVVSRAVQLLTIEGGTIATSTARAIMECANAQMSGVQMKIAGQPDPCPAVTEAAKARADALAEAVAKASEDARTGK